MFDCAPHGGALDIMIRRTLWLLLLLIASAIPAGAAGISRGSEPVWVDPGWRRIVAHYAITFEKSGLSTTVFEYEILAIDPKGAEAISQQVISYNSFFDEMVTADLATVKADGRVIAVDERAVRDQPASTDGSSPYFDEQRERIIAYSDVAPGDKVRGRVIYKDKRPMFEGQFAHFWDQPVDQPPEVMELTLDGPTSMPVRIVARDVEHREERVGDRIVHHVRFKQETPRPRLADFGTFDSARRFEASTFSDYAALAAGLNARNAPMAVPDAALGKFAADIVGDAATTTAKVERLHNWVARNVRYVGIGFEDGGLTSQPAAAVLAARYGDCKAHATLLKSLLASQGIEANLVVVNAMPDYTLTELPTQNFNHAIVYVPQLDQYLDPTASTVAFGALPPSLSGKPVLNIDKGRLARIPVSPSEQFTLLTTTDYTLAPDGKRAATSLLSGMALGAAIGRQLAGSLEQTDRPRLAEKMIKQANLQGSGDYRFSDRRELTNEYTITATFQLGALDLGKTLRVRMLPLTDLRPSLLVMSTGGIRDQPFRCHSLEYRETASLSLPDGINFSEKPAPVTYNTSFSGKTIYGDVNGRVEVTGEVIQDGRTVRSKYHVRLSFDAPVCPADFVGDIQRGLAALDQVKYGPIGLTPKGVPYVTEISPDYNNGVKAYDRKDYQLALMWLTPLADKGHTKARYYLGWMYQNGLGVAIDYPKAAYWYRLAAEQNDSSSQAELGYLYQMGLGVAPDDNLAVQWYAKSAKAGDQQGQMHLATMYRDGRGVARNFKEAERWFSMAADQGSAWAQMSLGLLYTHGGDGLPQDYARAVDLFRKAADQNDPDALYNLGWAYESGLGVPQDRQQAIEWYNKAAAKGRLHALRRMDGLSESNGLWSILGHILGF
jgi:TPR repeat protein